MHFLLFSCISYTDDIIILLNVIFTGLQGYEITPGFNTNKQRHRLLLLKTGIHVAPTHLYVKSVQSALSDLLTTSVTHGTFSRPSRKRGLILIGLELNTNARESFEHC